MVIDSSAVFAILLGEPERERFIGLIEQAPNIVMSAGTWIEVTVVNQRRQLLDPALLDRFGSVYDLSIVPVTTGQAELARIGYRRFGQASGHRARLNFGDCFAYALAKDTGEPVLCKGEDFKATDVMTAA